MSPKLFELTLMASALETKCKRLQEMIEDLQEQGTREVPIRLRTIEETIARTRHASGTLGAKQDCARSELSERDTASAEVVAVLSSEVVAASH